MNEQALKQKIIARLETSGEPMTATEIATRLALKGKQRKKLQKWLRQLVLSGEIVTLRKNRYALGTEADLLSGELRVLRSGKGVVGRPGGARVLIFPEDIGTALPGDRVLVRITPEARGRARSPAAGAEPDQYGKVLKILERARRDIVGTLKSTGRFFCVVPLDPSYKQDFYIAEAGEAKLGDRVVIRFIDWQNRHVSPEAEIMEILGPADSPSVDTVSIVRQYGLKDAFDGETLTEAEQASMLMDRPGKRVDMTDKFVITIDPKRASDFDDGVSLCRDDRGRRVLGVHIADVSHFVRPGSALDREALQRGNSVYLADMVIPMLPEQLSNGTCSLKPGETRLAFSVMLTLDEGGKVVARQFVKSSIRSRLRLTYAEAMKMLGSGTEEGRESGGSGRKRTAIRLLHELNEVAGQLRAARMAKHALDLDMPECEVVLARDGSIRGIRLVKSDEAHQLIEECMIAANEAVARELTRRTVPLISRVHERPVVARVRELEAELVGLGCPHHDLRKRENLAALLASLAGGPLAYHIRMAVLKSLSRAVYSATSHGHFGLAKRFYAHFTSPIRRYPDLVVHRQLGSALNLGHHVDTTLPEQGVADDLEAVAANCCGTEEQAEGAERALIEIKKYRLLAAQVSSGRRRVYGGVVVKVANFGMFVEALDLQIQGLVHVSEISEKFVRFNRRRGSLHAGKQEYKAGTQIRVRVVKVDLDNRRLDFELA